MQTPPNAIEDVEQQERSSVGGGQANGTATLKDGVVVSDNTKHIFTL